MVKNLRKRHVQIWLALLVLLPLSIITARLATPWPAVGKLLQPAADQAYPVIVTSVNKENYTVNLRKANDSMVQIEWVNKNTLTVPTATIYKVIAENNDVKNGSLIGRIEARGTYRFAVTKDFLPAGPAYHLVLYDFIHHQVIDTIKF